MIFSNTITLGLQYEESMEKLILTIIEAKILPISIKYNPGTDGVLLRKLMKSKYPSTMGSRELESL